MSLKINYATAAVGFFISLTILSAIAKTDGFIHSTKSLSKNNVVPADTPKLKFPIQDSQNGLTNSTNPFDITPSNVVDSVAYDPETNQYILIQTIGDQFYRDPTYMSFEEYLSYQSQKSNDEYFEQKANSSSLLDRKGVVPQVNVNSQIADRLFGGTNVDIRPQGNIELTFGGNYTNIQNPSLTEQQRKQGGFNFDMNIQMNVVGKIGEKLKLTTNYNTQAQFDFEKQVKLEYTGYPDEIIKKIEAGNVSFPLTTSLISGSQSLFGIKTQLQFGRLMVTSVISEQKSQSQNITVQNGQQTQTFSVAADQYDENRNFFLAQYFRDRYNQNMSQLPTITSPVNINKIEVWVTNKTGATVDTRDIVAFQDLAEVNPHSPVISSNGNQLPYAYSQEPGFNSNDLYTQLMNPLVRDQTRSLNTTVSTLTSNIGLVQVQDFEKTYARKLSPSEYTFQPQLGYIMLNSQLNPDEVLAVAYQYTYNGQVYQVGEFASDIPPNPSNANVIFLKLLKSTSVRPKLPIWDLMMKNVYSLGAYGISPQDFFLDVVYLDPGGGERRFIPSSPVNGTPLIRLLGLDRLNNQQDPQPDGIFDFVPGLTINPQNGKLIFPVLEPFGKDLNAAFDGSPNAARYVYQVLYDSTKTLALQFPEFNRFYLKGQYKSSSASDISLGAFNIPQGSVSVTAGGRLLSENVDYTIDYNLGRLKVINSSILNSGVPINVKFENNPAFVFNKKTMFGTRLDYYINDRFKLGGTFMKLSERPYTKKLNVGDDPISNAIYGADASYQTESGWLTKVVDKIPLIATKERSTITLTAEGAKLDPGHSRAIGKTGQVYIDDFEGTQSTYDLKFPFSSWTLASTPTDPKFPEATLIDDLTYGFRRAKLQWYNIDPVFYSNNAPSGIKDNFPEQYGLYTRQIYETDIFPQKSKLNQNGLPPVLTTFDLTFDPRHRGPYNYSADVNPTTGELLNPTENWGGIMRSLDYNDFEAANIEFVQFWILNPYLNGFTGTQGEIHVQLGNISEDILKDSRLFFENALPKNGTTPTNDPQPNVSASNWSYFPIQNQPPITNSFDNDPNARQFQDVGYDGARVDSERVHFINYLNLLQGISPALHTAAFADPSSDNYLYYRDAVYDNNNTGIINRYRDYNNPEGNSPITQNNQSQSSSSTNLPESEDLNRDNTLSETEEYFDYKFSLKEADLQQGQNFVTDIVETPTLDPDGNPIGPDMQWIQVKIPINSYSTKTGGIQDFKSIRFIRVYIDGFDQPVTLRFGKLELLRNQWRRYNFSLLSPGEYIPDDNSANTYFNVSSVSYEENGTREPVNYVLPPGIEQEQAIGTVNNYLQNEQSLSMNVCNLADGDARAAYKTLNLDLRTFDSLKMYVHAESVVGETELQYGDVTAFIRLGSDFVSNYYEYEIPLTITGAGQNADYQVWPTANNFVINLKDLTAIKQQRNSAGGPVTLPFMTTSGTARVTLVGNPDLGLVKVAMLGVRNSKQGSGYPPAPYDDAGTPLCAEVWFNEMRLSGFDEQGGYAALARADVRLADLGNVTLSGSLHTIGFGTLEQKLNERFKDNFYQYDASTTLELGKFIPKKVGLKLPLYMGISKSYSNPKYDPYELDVLLKDKLNLIQDKAKRDSAKRAAQDFTSIKSLNLSNVRRINSNKSFKPRFYSIENVNATYAFTRTFRSTPIIERDNIDRHHAELGYAFPGKSKFIQPFNKMLSKSTGKYWKPIKEFNFNFLPTNLLFRTAYDRQLGETLMRPRNSGDPIEPTFNKYFTNDRFYGAKLDLTRGISVDYSAVNNARIDEPFGKIDTKEEKDSIWTNIKKLGRNTHFHQNANASYTLPFSKIPALDWISSTAKYGADYDWLTAPQVLDTIYNPDSTIYRVRQIDNPLGNVISNGQNISMNGDFNIRNLYGKWKWLKRFDTNYNPGKAPPKGDTKSPPKPGDKPGDLKNNAYTGPPKPGIGTFFLRTLISLKKINLSYTQNRATTLPGFVYRTQALGQNFTNSAPGFDFILGMQPGESWLNDAADKGWISKSPELNYQFFQTLSRTMTARTSLEPIKDFNIDVNFSRNYTRNQNAVFHNANTIDDPIFQLLNPQQTGTYSITFIAIKTALQKSDSGYSKAFNDFSSYRVIMSQRWKSLNGASEGIYFNPVDSSFNDNYAEGYGPYAQEVLVPAFIAAYSGRDPNKVKLGNVFRMIPLPNWRVTYNGLSKMKWAKKYFSNLSLSHGYTSTLAVGTYTTSLNFEGQNQNDINLPSRIDLSSGNFISYYDIPGISISERFSPLIGVDITWKNGLTTKLDFGKGRNLAMSFLNYQLAETKNTDLNLTLGYKWKKFPIPFKIRGKKRRLPNDLNLNLQTGINKNETNNFKLDLNQPGTPTQGNTTIQFSPSADYKVNDRLNVKLFLDKRWTIPSTSASYPVNYTNAGVTIRFTLQ